MESLQCVPFRLKKKGRGCQTAHYTPAGICSKHNVFERKTLVPLVLFFLKQRTLRYFFKLSMIHFCFIVLQPQPSSLLCVQARSSEGRLPMSHWAGDNRDNRVCGRATHSIFVIPGPFFRSRAHWDKNELQVRRCSDVLSQWEIIQSLINDLLTRGGVLWKGTEQRNKAQDFIPVKIRRSLANCESLMNERPPRENPEK